MRSVFVFFSYPGRFVKAMRLVAVMLPMVAARRDLHAQSHAFVQQPQAGTRYPGDGFLLSCVVTSAPSITYQWYQDTNLLAGATSSQLFLSNLTLTAGGNYSVVAASGSASITSTPAALVVLTDTNITGTIQDVRHVVIFMQENRSFDGYLGSLRGVRGFNDRNALLLQNGNTVFSQPANGTYVLPFHVTAECLEDDAHSWGDEHTVWDSGKWDQWIPDEGTTAMSYYTRDDLPYFYALAESYTVCDAYFCSALAPTYPNRECFMTGMMDPNGTGGGPQTGSGVPLTGFTWTTYPERLQAAGVSWKVYQQSTDFYPLNALSWFAQYMNASPGNPLYDNGQVLVDDLVTAFQADVASNTLPRVSWIIPPWSQSEHPPYNPANGDVLTKQLLDTLASNPAVYNSTVFILTYDEAGGYFDHVPPPVPPPGTSDEFVGGMPIGLGARVPTVLASPWTRGGYVCSQVFDHTSILRFLETWTGVRETNISAWRRQVCGDLTSAFNFVSPNTNYPSLPSVIPDDCSGAAVTPPVPSPQSMPVQEVGTLISRPLPYQPNASSVINCGSGRILISMTNSGTESVHFMIFPNAYRSDGPWQYDVAASNSQSDSFGVSAINGGPYDLTCYGPNGFQRRFADNLYTNCGQVEVTSSIDPNAGVVSLAMQNLTATTVVFTVTNSYPTGGPWIYNVPASTTVTDIFPVVANNNGWYDMTATASSDNLFLRRFAGHIEVPDFSILIIPGAQSLTVGTNAIYTVNLGVVSGFSAVVSLSVTGLPAGVSAGFTPSAITGSGTSTLSMVVSNSTAPGNYPLTITGTSSNTTHTATITLTVHLPDADGDGIPDSWTQQYFGSSTGLVSNLSMANQDADGTGQNNLFKYIAGLDPTNPASVFVLNIIGPASAPNLVFYPVVPGRTYTPQFSIDACSGNWSPLTSIAGPVTNGDQVTITDLTAPQSNGFYRLSISLP